MAVFNDTVEPEPRSLAAYMNRTAARFKEINHKLDGLFARLEWLEDRLKKPQDYYLDRMTPERRELYERIKDLRVDLTDEDFNVVNEIRRMRGYTDTDG